MNAKRLALLAAMLIALQLSVFSQTFYQGVVKPVNIKDYDGTMSGVSGTGTFGYTTLYRDNYLGPPPIGGEGNGSHPGVDIGCPSGTTVVAIAPGTVIISKDDDYYHDDHVLKRGWGGLIVIKHNPSDIPGITEPVYSIYGHLRQRLVAGGPVSGGTPIGVSGGKFGTDPHSGFSDGSHLHFQIDRDKTVSGISFTSPYFPSDGSQAVNQADNSHAVEGYTYHPMHFLKYRTLAPIGFFKDKGWSPTNGSEAFVKAYISTLGQPYNNNGGGQFVHWWSDAGPGNPMPGVWIQDFYHAETNKLYALIRNPNGNVYLIKEGFRGWYMDSNHFGYKELGAPTENERPDPKSEYTAIQKFERAMLTWNGSVVQKKPLRPEDLPTQTLTKAPQVVAAADFSKNTVSLVWEDPGNPSGTTYKVFQGNQQITTTSNVGYVAAALMPDVGYQYKVVAVNNSVESIPSNTVVTGTTPDTTRTGKGYATIITDPSGAQIWRDSVFWKTSPVVSETLDVGNYLMVAKKTGYGDTSFDFSVLERSPSPVNVRLNPASFPLTIEAESMQGTGQQVFGGRKLVGANDWYIFENFNLPEAGRIEFEVIAKAEWQVNGYWPKLEVAGPVQEIPSTDYASYFYYADYIQGGQFQVNIKQDEWTRTQGGHSIIVDKCILRYVAVPPPTAPSNCAAAFNQSTATITWMDNSTNEEGFKIDYQFGESPNWSSFTAPANATSAQYTAGSPNNELYRFRVKAYVASGAVNSALSNETLGKILSIPSNLAASAVSSSKINLSWTDNSSLEDGFKIERKPSGGSFSEIASTAANATSFSDSVGLSPSTTYVYRIRAFALSDGTTPNVSNYSSDASATTPLSVGNLIKDSQCDGPFDPNGTNGWIMMDDEQTGTHDVTFSTSSPLSGSSSMLVHNDVATTNWTGIKQKIDLIQGHDYRVSFVVKSDNSGPYSTFVDALSLVDWQGQGAWYSYNVTNTRTVHSHQFNCRSTATSLFAFQFGPVVGNVRMDSVSVVDLSSPPPSNPVLSISTTTLNLGSASTGTLSGSFNISNAGGGTLSWTNTEDGNITMSSLNGTGNATVDVFVNASGLSLGSHTDYVYVASNGGNATVNVSYIVTASGGDYTDDPGNLFVNGKANTVTDLSQGPVGSWYAEPRSGSNLVQFTSNALYGPYSLEIVKASAQGGDGDTRILQAVSLQAGKQYRLVALMENSSNISGSASITNFEWGGSWNWQNLWWQQTLSPGKKRIAADFTSNITGNVAIQFQWGLVTGSTRIDSLIVREKVETALGPNLLTNGDAEDTNDDLTQGVVGSWFGEPTNGANLVRYTNNAIQGSSSSEIVKGSVQSGEGDTRLMQAPSLQAGKKYRLSFIMDNATGTSGSASITNYQWGGSWNWQNLWWQQSLSSGRQVISLDFIPNVTGDIAIQFQWGLVVGSTRFDSISVKEVALAKSTEPSELDGTLSIPATFQLYQNHPNPFNPTTEFRFDLPERAHGTLTVYNITGQKVTILLDEEIAAGTHRVQWNASNLPSGVYIYELKTGQFLARKKLALVK